MFSRFTLRTKAMLAGVVASGVAVAVKKDQSPHGGLNPADFVGLKLKEIDNYNHNTKVYHFALPETNGEGNFPITSYVLCKANIGEEGKPVVRPYTPINADGKGVVSLIVKTYPNGTMSKHFATLKVGDTMEVKGPLPKFKYEVGSLESVTLIAGGTGIAPVLQLAEAILNNKDDKTKVNLVFANTSSSDILLKEYIDDLAAKKKDQFKVTYVIDKAEASWKGPTGFLTADLLSQHIEKPSASNKVFICGPPPMMASVSGSKAKDYTQGEVDGALKTLGFTKDNVFKF